MGKLVPKNEVLEVEFGIDVRVYSKPPENANLLQIIAWKLRKLADYIDRYRSYALYVDGTFVQREDVEHAWDDSMVRLSKNVESYARIRMGDYAFEQFQEREHQENDGKRTKGS